MEITLRDAIRGTRFPAPSLPNGHSIVWSHRAIAVGFCARWLHDEPLRSWNGSQKWIRIGSVFTAIPWAAN